MMRSGVVAAVLLVACGKGSDTKAASAGSGSAGSGSALETAPFASFDAEADAFTAYFDHVSAAIDAAGADCDKLEQAFASESKAADALAPRIAKLDAPPARQSEVGKQLEAKMERWTPKIKDCMGKPGVAGFFQSSSWVAVRHQAMEWANTAAAPTNTVVNAERCTAAVQHAIDVDAKGVTAELSLEESMAKDLAKLLSDRCIKDQWDAVAVTCFESTKASVDLLSCVAKLPDAQKKGIDADLAAHRAKPADAPPEYEFTTIGFEIASIVHKGSVPTGFGKVAVTTYLATPKDELVGNTMSIKVYDLPAKWQKSKPEAVFAQQHADLVKQKLKFDKDEKITVGASPGHDVQLTGTQQDPELGVALVRQRWFVHGGKLWIVGALAMSKQKQSAKLVAQGDHWVDSFAFADKTPEPKPADKKPPKGKK